MKKLEDEYKQILRNHAIDDNTLDYSILERHIEHLSADPFFKGSALSVFDMYKKTHVYESECHKELFKNEDETVHDVEIHPEDFEMVMKNGIAAMRHVFQGNRYAKYSKLIREYRALIKGCYRRITEEIQVLETDENGNVWLALSIVNISPNQQSPYTVKSVLINSYTGDIFSPLDEYYDRDVILSSREIEILKFIEQGKLSKEIAEQLNISVNTVNTHRQRILKKLKVYNSIEAIKYAQTLGLLDA